MTDGIPVVVATIGAISAICCEVIRRLPTTDPAPHSIESGEMGQVPGRLVGSTFADHLKPARNFFSIIAAFGLAIFVWTVFPIHSHVRTSTISFTQTPPASAIGGPEKMALIAGVVSGGAPGDLQIVIYAHTDHWRVQPYFDSPKTGIRSDGQWENDTHLGDSYAVLLVKPSFVPPRIVDALPNLGGEVITSTTVAGR